MPTLEDALQLATAAHRGQVDRNGAPYILHPLRVMLQLHTEAERIIALLHDVVEDTPHTLADLHAAGYPPDIVTVVDHLTRREQETYDAYITRVLQDPLACRIKLADLRDNMDPTRLKESGAAGLERLQRYQRAWERISASLPPHERPTPPPIPKREDGAEAPSSADGCKTT